MRDRTLRANSSSAIFIIALGAHVAWIIFVWLTQPKDGLDDDYKMSSVDRKPAEAI